jgi:Fic family protein
LLVDLALVHYQFETIHPFYDGNGRIGRLLIPLILITQGRIKQPLLYVSAYLDRNKEEYQDRLFRVSTRGEWKEWILFFLKTIERSAEDCTSKAEKLRALREEYMQRITTPRSSALTVNLIDELFQNPVLTFKHAEGVLNVSQPQASAHVRKLERLGIVKEQTGGSRNLRFVPEELLEIAFS